MPSTITLERSDHIARVRIQTRTMAPPFFDELAGIFEDLAVDDDVRCVVLSSTAKGFTYGLDLPAVMQEHGKLFAGGGASERNHLYQLITRWQRSMERVATCPVPVIAAIHGPCIGGGMDLICACDIRLASADAVFSVRETKVAIVADLGTLQRLPALVGEGNARELAFTGKDIDAQRALQMHLVSEVFPDRDALQSGAMAMATEIASNPPLTVRGVKRTMDVGRDHGPSAGLAFVRAYNAAFLASEDLGEAMAAFIGKRSPNYRGR